jgi:hypothetical protein
VRHASARGRNTIHRAASASIDGHHDQMPLHGGSEARRGRTESVVEDRDRFSPCAFALKGLQSATARLSNKRILLNMMSSARRFRAFRLHNRERPRRQKLPDLEMQRSWLPEVARADEVIE